MELLRKVIKKGDTIASCEEDNQFQFHNLSELTRFWLGILCETMENELNNNYLKKLNIKKETKEEETKENE